MTHEAEFVRLEQFVEKLMAGYNNLQTEFADLQAQMHRLGQENAELAEALAGLRQERQDIRSRVSGLIGRIEEWEEGLKAEDEPEKAMNQGPRDEAAGQQTRLFNPADVPDPETPY